MSGDNRSMKFRLRINIHRFFFISSRRTSINTSSANTTTNYINNCFRFRQQEVREKATRNHRTGFHLCRFAMHQIYKFVFFVIHLICFFLCKNINSMAKIWKIAVHSLETKICFCVHEWHSLVMNARNKQRPTQSEADKINYDWLECVCNSGRSRKKRRENCMKQLQVKKRINCNWK